MTLTHNDIYIKFMIEYDKANVTSSYPSLTEYEVATFLDKAYNALIAQKVTGNNVRRSTLESDVKSIADLGPLINQKKSVAFTYAEDAIAPNVIKTRLPGDYLYFLDAYLKYITAFGHYNEVHDTVTRKNTMLYSVFQDYKPTSEGFNLEIGEDPETHDPIYLFNDSSEVFYLKKTTGLEEVELKYNTSGSTPSTFKYLCVTRTVDEHGVVTVTTTWTQPATGDLEDIAEEVAGIPSGSDVLVWSEKDGSEDSISAYAYKEIEYTEGKPYDDHTVRMVPTKLVTHEIASKFFSSSFNMPWIKIPVSYIEDDYLYVVYDSLNSPEFDGGTIIYIKKPNTFVKDVSVPEIYNNGSASFFEFKQGTQEGQTDILPPNPTVTEDDYIFECNSTVAEELISLAVSFALENVESQRLNSKLNMRGLEA